MRRARGLAATIALLLVVGACGDDQTSRKEETDVQKLQAEEGSVDDQPAPAGTLWVRGAGATFPSILYKKWVETYNKGHPGIWVTYSAVGSGAGISRFVTGSVDFGASDAAMSDKQITQVDRGVRLVPATAGMVVLAYSLEGVSGELKLSRDVYPAIFAGDITYWDDPRIQDANPDLKLPHQTITTVVRRDGSGTTFAFTNHLSAISEAWRDGPGTGKLIEWPGNAMTALGNEGVAQRIRISDGAIGYIGYEFATRLGLRMAAIQNKDGEYVKPSAEAGQKALAAASGHMPDNLRLFIPDPGGTDSYPIVTYSWLLLYAKYSNQRKMAAVKDFVTWGLTKGQGFSGSLGYAPLPENVVALSRQAVDSIR